MISCFLAVLLLTWPSYRSNADCFSASRWHLGIISSSHQPHINQKVIHFLLSSVNFSSRVTKFRPIDYKLEWKFVKDLSCFSQPGGLRVKNNATHWCFFHAENTRIRVLGMNFVFMHFTICMSYTGFTRELKSLFYDHLCFVCS